MSATAAPGAAVEVRDVRMVYRLPPARPFGPRRALAAVDGVSFDVAPGTTFGLVGESGSGKSTVAKLLLKLERPTGGTVRVDGADVFAQDRAAERAYRRTVQAVLQDPYGALSPRLSVGTIVAEPALAQGGLSRAAARDLARGLLETVGLPADAAGQPPHRFSGGQRQRIAIARALSVAPRLLVLDECVSALDVSVRAQILTLLRDLQRRQGISYLFISHDLAVVRFMSTTVGVMYLGRLVEVGAAREVFGRPRHPYTRRLVAAAGGRVGDPGGGDAEMPSPLAPPSGCRYHTRCPSATGICRTVAPDLRAGADGHAVACHLTV